MTRSIAVLFLAVPMFAQNPPANPPTTTTDPTGRACASNSVLNYIPSGVLFTCQNGVYAQVKAGSQPLIYEGIPLSNATYPAVRAYGITTSTDTDIYTAPGASSPAAISGCTNASPTVCTFASAHFSVAAGAFA